MPEDLTPSQQLIVLDGTTFVVSQPDGEMTGGDTTGFFHEDVRHLSHLATARRRRIPITASPVDYYFARIVLGPSTSSPGYALRRDRFVTEGMHEDIVGLEPRRPRAACDALVRA